MKSGLEGRNNAVQTLQGLSWDSAVSMKSGLEGRNNLTGHIRNHGVRFVSMKSGLEGRNNRPRLAPAHRPPHVSMKSGLEDWNNVIVAAEHVAPQLSSQ